MNSDDGHVLARTDTWQSNVTRYVLIGVTLAACLLVAVSGCVSSVKFVVVADVPPSPSFTVIPMSTSLDDGAAANSVTEELVALGVRVLERPALVKQRTEYTGKSSGSGVGVTLDGKLAVGGVGGAQAGDVTTSIDPISLIQETQADYVVFAKAGSWLKIVKREDGQIVFAGSLAAESRTGCCLSPAFWGKVESEHDRLRDMLRQMGVATK